MKRFHRLIWIFLAATDPMAGGDGLSAFFHESPEVVANTDVFDHNAPVPAPGRPVYYLAVSAGYRDLGYSMPAQQIPDAKGVLRMATRILEGQGYKMAPAGQTPSIMILCSWGTLYRNPNPYALKTYVPEMLKFLGAYKASMVPGPPNMFQPEIENLGALVPQGIYVMTISAFDFAVAQKGVAKPLWKTNISNSTRGFYLPEILPTMLTVAAPLIGRETTHPVWINVDKHNEGRVDFGPLKVIEMDVKSVKHN